MTPAQPNDSAAQHWPCPNNCLSWCRVPLPGEPLTNHHPRCEFVDASLIDVWRVSYDGRSYVMDRDPTGDCLGEGETVTKEKMHREIYEQLPDFNGF